MQLKIDIYKLLGNGWVYKLGGMLALIAFAKRLNIPVSVTFNNVSRPNSSGVNFNSKPAATNDYLRHKTPYYTLNSMYVAASNTSYARDKRRCAERIQQFMQDNRKKLSNEIIDYGNMLIAQIAEQCTYSRDALEIFDLISES